MASSPPRSISAVQASMLRRAWSSALRSLPMWWTSAPQQPSPAVSTTSTPCRLSSRIAASLISGASTGWAQPLSSATRPLRSPSGLNSPGWTAADAAGSDEGDKASIAASLSPCGRRRIQLVAEQHISRAGGGAKAAMHAGAQDLFRFADLWIEQLLGRKIGLHDYALILPGLRMPAGSNVFRMRAVSAASGPAGGVNG